MIFLLDCHHPVHMRKNSQESVLGTFEKFPGNIAKKVSVAMPADSRREKIFDFVREFAVKYFRIVPVRDSTQQNKA